MAKRPALLKTVLVTGQLPSFPLFCVDEYVIWYTMFILQIGFKNIRQHILHITERRAEIFYISKRSKPIHGAEIEETHFVPQATTNPSTWLIGEWLFYVFLTPPPESYVPIIPWPPFKHALISHLLPLGHQN